MNPTTHAPDFAAAAGFHPGAGARLEVMEGSTAIAQAVKACRPAVIAAYPITPQTHIIETLAAMAANGELAAEYLRVESEFSAASAIAGASAAGARAYTASASQGLLLMTEVIYYMAGSRFPVVLTAANRQVSVPIGLQPDHQDSLSLRDTGVIQLYVESVQEAYDTHIQAFKIAEDRDVLLPVMVCLDGFTLTHVYEPVGLLPQTAVDAFLPPFDPPVMLDPRKPAVFGSHVDETNALEFRYMLHKASQGALSRVQAVAEEYRQAFGPYHGGLIDAYAAEDAEIILVAMGSAVSTLREAVDVLRSEGQPVGLVKIRCYRPFPAEALRAALGGARAVVVLDRALSMGFQGIVAGDVQAALYPLAQRPAVVAALAGFGGREVTLETARLLVSQARRVLAGEALAPDEAFVGLKPELIGRLEGGAE